MIMFSDGICQSDEDSAWLLEMLAKPISGSLKDYAEYILSEAKKACSVRDDMSVIVLKIKESDGGTVKDRAS